LSLRPPPEAVLGGDASIHSRGRLASPSPGRSLDHLLDSAPRGPGGAADAAVSLKRDDLLDLRDLLPGPCLVSHLQRGRRARASAAGSLHVELDAPVVEASEHDVTTVHRHGGPDLVFEDALDALRDLAFAGAGRRLEGRAERRAAVAEAGLDRVDDRLR